MYQASELPEENVNQFNADYAPIKLTRIDSDYTAFFAALAAGNPPDLMRTQAPDIPQFVARNIMMDLQSYFDASTVLKEADLYDVNNYYKASSPTEIGSGPHYGMAKDWAPDGFLWVNEMAFEMAGATPPDPAKMPVTSADVVDLAKAATKTEGDQVTIMGFNTHTGFIDRFWMNLAKMAGGSLFSADFKKASVVGNQPVVDAIKYFYDMMDEGVMNSPLHPSVNWFAPDFANAQLAMVYTGYWFSGQVKDLATAEDATQEAKDGLAQNKWKMYPMFTWQGVRSDPCISAAGAIIVNPRLKTTAPAHPDAAWTVFEWFMGKEPAQDRAKGGWGLPALKSLMNLVPQVTDFDKQAYATIQAELEYAGDTLQFNPYLSGGEPMVPGQTFMNNLEAMLKGDKAFDDVLAQIESDTNAAIQDGSDAIG